MQQSRIVLHWLDWEQSTVKQKGELLLGEGSARRRTLRCESGGGRKLSEALEAQPPTELSSVEVYSQLRELIGYTEVRTVRARFDSTTPHYSSGKDSDTHSARRDQLVTPGALLSSRRASAVCSLDCATYHFSAPYVYSAPSLSLLPPSFAHLSSNSVLDAPSGPHASRRSASGSSSPDPPRRALGPRSVPQCAPRRPRNGSVARARPV